MNNREPPPIMKDQVTLSWNTFWTDSTVAGENGDLPESCQFSLGSPGFDLVLPHIPACM